MSEDIMAIHERQHVAIWDDHNPDAIDEYFATNVVNHNSPPGVPANRDGIKGVVTAYFGAFPDLKVINDIVLTDGDKVITRWTATGTHSGPLGEIPATGKQVSTHGISIIQYENGKVTAIWSESDQMDLLQQLGVMPMPGE